MSHPPVSPFSLFSPLSLRPGVVGVCFEVSEWMSCLHGCSLWSRGFWLGGSLVRHWALLVLTPSDLAPGVFVVFLCFASCLESFSSWHTSCHHAWIPIAGCNPSSWCSFSWFVFCLVCCCFCVLFCVFGFLLGLHTGLRTGPLPVLLWLSTIDSLAR